MSGDPSLVVELVALMPELYCHVIVDAGRPVAMHVKVAGMPSVIGVTA